MSTRNGRPDRRRLAVEARDLVERAAESGATPDGAAAMGQWRAISPDHAAALSDAEEMRRRMLAARDAICADRMLRASLAPVPPPRRSMPMVGRRAFIGGAVAASAAAAIAVQSPLGLWPSLAEWRADFRTGKGERRTIKVAQGFSVELNTLTSLDRREDPQAWRLALVAGEVAVDAVHPARPAVIATDAGEARAANGRFSVRLAHDGTCVTCFAGAVAVVDHESREVRLGQGERVTIGSGGLGAVAAIDPGRAEAWRHGQLVFTDQPLSEVVGEINRYRPGRIILANSELGHIPVNAIFQLDAMDRAVTQIRLVARASATNLPGGIVLLS